VSSEDNGAQPKTKKKLTAKVTAKYMPVPGNTMIWLAMFNTYEVEGGYLAFDISSPTVSLSHPKYSLTLLLWVLSSVALFPSHLTLIFRSVFLLLDSAGRERPPLRIVLSFNPYRIICYIKMFSKTILYALLAALVSKGMAAPMPLPLRVCSTALL